MNHYLGFKMIHFKHFFWSWIQGPSYKGGNLSGIPTLWFLWGGLIQRKPLHPIQKSVTQYFHHLHVCVTLIFLHIPFPGDRVSTIFSLTVLVIHWYLSKMIRQPPSLELALWPEDPALDPALASHVRHLTFCKLLVSLMRLTMTSHVI